MLGNCATAAGKTDTFLGERYRRIGRRRGKKKALVAVGRSRLVIIWHLLSTPDTRFHDLGSDYYDTRIDPDRRKRNHIRQKPSASPSPSRPPHDRDPVHPSAPRPRADDARFPVPPFSDETCEDAPRFRAGRYRTPAEQDRDG